jgi:hypothetical protein
MIASRERSRYPALFLTLTLVTASCVTAPSTGGIITDIGLPDLVIDALEFGPASCINARVRNIGPGSKAAGAVVSYRFDAAYHNPERSRTLRGTDALLTQFEIPSGWDRELVLCDVAGDAINAYRTGSVRLTVNPTGTLAEVSTLNNTRDATVPHWIGADIEIIGGGLAAGGVDAFDPVIATVIIKNLGNQLPNTAMPGVIVRIIPRGHLPGPFPPFEVRYLVYDPLGPEEQRTLRIALTPPLPVISQLPPGFFQCVWGIAQLDTVGYSLYIHPPEYAGRFASGGVPTPDQDPGGAACWSTIQLAPRPRTE